MQNQNSPSLKKKIRQLPKDIPAPQIALNDKETFAESEKNPSAPPNKNKSNKTNQNQQLSVKSS
jgi:hypothetical protein